MELSFEDNLKVVGGSDAYEGGETHLPLLCLKFTIKFENTLDTLIKPWGVQILHTDTPLHFQ